MALAERRLHVPRQKRISPAPFPLPCQHESALTRGRASALVIDPLPHTAPGRRNPTTPMCPSDSPDYAWFADYLQPHERTLRAWLRARYPDSPDVDDIVQEAFMRALDAHRSGSLRSPRAFVFTTARNLALNQIRRRRNECAEELAENELQSVLTSEQDIRDGIALKQEFELLTTAIQSLPNRCRQVITLRKLYGLSQKEVAVTLGIAEHTVESQTTIGLRKLSEFFFRRGFRDRGFA
ncbi:MAG: RNA polymerase sigma factor [Opitutaceae bacterium]